MLKNKSYFKKSTGDEAGRAPKKGLITSTNKGKVYFNSWSMNVKIEGKNVVRHLDLTTHNHGSYPPNTPPTAHSATSAPAPAALPVVHARLRLKSVTFSGGHDVDNDTFGDFPTPHFLTGRGPNNSRRVQRPAQFPYAIPRATKLGATAVFDVIQQPTNSEQVTVDAETTVGSKTLRFKGTVTVGPSDTEVKTSRLESDVALPDMILKVDPLTLAWYQKPVDVKRRSAGSSTDNILYITLAAPKTSPLYWTLLEVSCTAAMGETTPAKLRSKSYGALQSRAITRARDGHDLTYWEPDTTMATNTELLLGAADGSGQCGSWAEFLIDMWKAHGDEGGHKVLIKRSSSDCEKYIKAAIQLDYILKILNPSGGGSPSLSSSNRNLLIREGKRLYKIIHDTIFFLVKDWLFKSPHPLDPSTFFYEIGVKCLAQKRVAAQNNDDSPPDFCNHFIVIAGGEFYDPILWDWALSDEAGMGECIHRRAPQWNAWWLSEIQAQHHAVTEID